MSKVLIVVDMQNDFIDGALGTPEAQAIVPAVKRKIRDYAFAGDVVLLTADTHDGGYLSTQEGANLPVPHCVEGTAGWEVSPALDLFEGARLYKKNTFGSVDLAVALCDLNRNDPIASIELVGLCTDICVISNALLIKAFLPEVPISVDASCCAGVTPQSHATALAAMKACQVQITNEV